MKKFNQFEGILIQEGLKLVMESRVSEVRRAEAQGKTPIVTAEFFEMTIKELMGKVDEMTKMEK